MKSPERKEIVRPDSEGMNSRAKAEKSASERRFVSGADGQVRSRPT